MVLSRVKRVPNRAKKGQMERDRVKQGQTMSNVGKWGQMESNRPKWAKREGQGQIGTNRIKYPSFWWVTNLRLLVDHPLVGGGPS